MQTCVHLVDLVKSFPTNIYLQKLASIQPRTSPSKFGYYYSILFIRVLIFDPAGRGQGIAFFVEFFSRNVLKFKAHMLVVCTICFLHFLVGMSFVVKRREPRKVFRIIRARVLFGLITISIRCNTVCGDERCALHFCGDKRAFTSEMESFLGPCK